MADEVHPHPPEAEGNHGGHASHAAGHRKHGGHEGGHGGHGGSWIVTYSDMVTLLMAFFIAIITFSSSNVGQKSRKKDSAVDGRGGTGVAGPSQKGNPRMDAIVWRLHFRQPRFSETGPEFAPLYRDPSEDTAKGILKALLGTAPGKLGDSYILRLPLSLLFDPGGKLTSSGSHILGALAANLRELPYDFQFRVQDPDQIPLAVRLCSFLSSDGGMHPGRLAVGVRADEGDEDSVWVVLTRQT